MTVEAGVAIVASLLAGSVALLSFGLDSLIELASASTILWLYTGSRGGSAAAERRAQQLVAICFAALALYIAFDAIDTLASARHPDVSWPGAVVAAAAIAVMPLLARAKGRVAVQLGSAATAGDAAQSWLCAISAAAVLVSILANAAFGWWWLDPIVGLGIAGIAVREGREAWAGDVCCDCAPIARTTPPIRVDQQRGGPLGRRIALAPRQLAYEFVDDAEERVVDPGCAGCAAKRSPAGVGWAHWCAAHPLKGSGELALVDPLAHVCGDRELQRDSRVGTPAQPEGVRCLVLGNDDPALAIGFGFR